MKLKFYDVYYEELMTERIVDVLLLNSDETPNLLFVEMLYVNTANLALQNDVPPALGVN